MAKPHLIPVKYDMHKSQIVAGILSTTEQDIPPSWLVEEAIRRARYPEIRGLLMKFIDDLRSWSPSRCKYAWTPMELIRECLNKGTLFYSEYKLAKREGMHRGMGAKDPITGEYMYGEADPDYWNGPDSWFDMRYSIFWELTSYDHEYMFHEGSGEDTLLDEDMLETFKSSVRSVIPDQLDIIEDVQEIYAVSGAKSYDPTNPNGKRKPEWLETHGVDVYDDGPPIPKVKGIQIPKCASETRDGVCISPHTKRCLSKVGRAISQLIRSGPFKKRHPTGMTYEEVDSKLSHLSTKWAWFLCLDFEKAGLTLPTHIIRAVLEACYDATEYEPFLEAKSFFENLEYYGDTEYETVLRGFCLGLFNEGMTLVQLALHRIACDEIGTDYDGMFLNDDGVIAFGTETDACRYAMSDAVTCLELGIPRQDLKSFLSRGYFVFCEEYYNEGYYYPKNALRKCAYNACYYMPTIRLAKDLFASITMSLGLDKEVLAPLVEHWGYEFYEGEHLQPYEFGGWYHIMREGYNVCCWYYQPNYDFYWAYKAINLKLSHRGKVGHRPTQPLSRILHAVRCEPNENLIWEPEIRMEDLFGDPRAIGFYRGQTADGRDNSNFNSDLIQRKVVKYFKENRAKLPPSSLVRELALKGYAPVTQSMPLEGIYDSITFQGYGPRPENVKNSRLVLDLSKLGVYYDHPDLNDISVHAARNFVVQSLLRNEPTIPFRGIKSFEPTESNLKLVNLCLNIHGCIPGDLVYDNYDLAFLAVWGFIPTENTMEMVLRLLKGEETFDKLRELKEYFDQELLETLEPEQELDPVQEPIQSEPDEDLDFKVIMVRESHANSAGYIPGEGIVSSQQVRTLSVLSTASDVEIWQLCQNLGVIPIGIPFEEEEYPMDDIVDPFGSEANSGDY